MHKFDVSVAKKGDKWFGNKRKINKTKAEIRTIHLSGKVCWKINKTKKTFSLQGCTVWQIMTDWWLPDDYLSTFCLTDSYWLPGSKWKLYQTTVLSKKLDKRQRLNKRLFRDCPPAQCSLKTEQSISMWPGSEF